MPHRTVGVYLSFEVIDLLKDAAQRRGISLNAYLRLLIYRGAERLPPSADADYKALRLLVKDRE